MSDAEKTCIATTSDGDTCNYTAKYPEDDPKYCGVHYDSDEDKKDNNSNERYIVYN